MTFFKGCVSPNKYKKLPHLVGSSANHWKGGKINKICKYCANNFSVFLYRNSSAMYCSRSCQAKDRTKENSANWKGGITPEKHKQRTSQKYEFWRKNCLTRDNFLCSKCGASGGSLAIHHINNFSEFPELIYSIDNGITLCAKCHKEFHNKYGYKNNTQQQILEFI